MNFYIKCAKRLTQKKQYDLVYCDKLSCVSLCSYMELMLTQSLWYMTYLVQSHIV